MSQSATQIQSSSQGSDKAPTQKNYRGELVISICYKPTAVQAPSTEPISTYNKLCCKKSNSNTPGILQVKVIKGLNLQTPEISTDNQKQLNAFVKVVVIPGRSKYGKKKTSVIQNTNNPVWNTVFEFFGLPENKLSSSALELGVWNNGKSKTSKDFIGGLRLNLGEEAFPIPAMWMDGTGQEITIWKEVINRPDEWNDGTLTLRSYMEYAG